MYPIVTAAVAAAAQPPATEQSTLILYIVAVGSALVAVATYVPKIFGPIGKAIAQWSSSMRRAAQDVEDARIADLGAQLAAKSALMAEQDEEIRGLRRLIRRIREAGANHGAWDWKALAVLRRTEPDYPASPALDEEEDPP